MNAQRNPSHKQQESQKAASLAPHRVLWKAYVLTDELAHSAISTAAKSLESKTGLERKTLAQGALGAGTIATGLILAKEPALAISYSVVSPLVFIIYAKMMGKAMEVKASASAVAENMEKIILKFARLPLLGWSIASLSQGYLSGDREKAALGIYAAGLAIAAYLATSGTGMLDRAKDYLKEKLASLSVAPQQVPQSTESKH